jgi:DNA polymerase III alpha subunit
MHQLRGRRVDDYGQVIFDQDGICDLLLNGDSIDNIIGESSPEILDFRRLYKEWDNGECPMSLYTRPQEDPQEYHLRRQQSWFIPDTYKTLDVEELLLERCDSAEAQQRVCTEMSLFKDANMISVLQFLIFLVDTLTEQNVVWGVGRGSSVASYCLFLIGIHRIDSLKHDLDFAEFLK